MRVILAVILLAACAIAQQQTKPCPTTQTNDGTVCKGPIRQPASTSPKSAPKSASTLSPAWERPEQTVDYQKQIELNNQVRFTLAPAVARSAAFSNAFSNAVSNPASSYVPPPQLTPLHQTSDDFHSTAGFAVGSAVTHEIQLHREKAFVKKFCKTYGSGVAWWYQFASGDRIEGVCQ